jgi:hypothetical protein
MNPISSLIFKWYCFLTLLAIFAAITTDILLLLSGLLLLWIVFIIFFISTNDKIILYSNKHTVPRLPPNLDGYKAHSLFVLSPLTIFASYYATMFYTGKSFTDIVLALSIGSSLYNDYQAYFAQQGLGIFSVRKIPAILSMFYLKIIVVYGFISVIILSEKIRFSQCWWLFIASMSSVYFSIARGTSFEFFELLLLMWFCISMRSIRYGTKKSIFTSSNITMAVFGLLALAMYSYNISARYSFGAAAECISPDICLEPQSVLYYISAPLGELSLKLSGYFTFGIFYTSVLINDIWLDSFSNFFMLLLPLSSVVDLDPRFLCDTRIICGPNWTPDISVYFVKVGLLAVLILIYLIGIAVKKLATTAFLSNDFIKFCLLYYAFLALVSLPVGNFLTVSSANKLMLFSVFVIFNLRKLSTKI